MSVRVAPMGSWLRVGVGLIAAMLAAPAMAQPSAEEIAARAVANIRQATETTTGALVAAKSRAVTEIERLDLAGAPDHRIIAFGQRAVEALQRMGQGGRDRIEAITRNAVAALRRLNAPQALIDGVLHAAQTGRQFISQAQQRAVTDVRDAVREAIGPP